MKKKKRPIAKSTGKPKKKTGPKPIIPKNTPKRRQAIEEYKQKLKENPPKEVHPYSRHGGRPRLYATPEEMYIEIEGYFKWIQGEYEIRKTKVPAGNDKGYIIVDEEVCIRKPEPPTITGMCLYLGFFSGRAGLERYKYDHAGFVDVVNYGISRVANGYEANLHGAKCFGSTFALTNIQADSWKQKQEVYNDFSDNVIKGFNYLPPAPPPEDPRDESQDKTK
jgi:hypothetical protein